MMARVVVFVCLAAAVVFAAVQDRLTARGVARYVSLQRDALAGRRSPVSIDEIMKPANLSAARQAALAGSLVVAAGLAGTLAVRRRRRRE